MNSVYKLKYPVEVGKNGTKTTVEEITLDIMRGKHQLGAYRSMRERGITNPSDVELGLFVLAEMTGLSINVVQEFALTDINDLSVLMGGQDPVNFQKANSESSAGD